MAVAIRLIGIVASLYAASVVRSANGASSDMMENLDKSTLALARLNWIANTIGYGVDRSTAYSPATECALRSVAFSRSPSADGNVVM